MKIHQYNEMMRYLTRPARLESSPSEIIQAASNEQRETYAEGTSEEGIRVRTSPEEKQRLIEKINEFVDEKITDGEKVTLKDVHDEFGFKKRKDFLIKEALGKEYDNKITKLGEEGLGRVRLAVGDKLDTIIDEVNKGERPLLDLSRTNLNKELPPISERHLSKFLNENAAYKDLQPLVDKVQQRTTRGQEAFKDATVDNLESKLEQVTTDLRRPSPKRIEEFIVRDLVRHDNQGGDLFKVVSKGEPKFYDKIKILDVANDEILTTKNIKKLVDQGDPRFQEYKKAFDEIADLKKTPYVNPITKEETTLLKALQQATGNKQPLNIDHLDSVSKNPLENLAVSTYKSNTGANIKNVTPEDLDILGRKKFTLEQNVDRLTKFADRRLLQEAASGFEKVPTPSETLAAKKEASLASKVNNQLGFGPAAIADVGGDVVKDVKGLYGKYAPQVAKGAITGLRILGTPAVSAALYAEDVASDIKKAAAEGNVTAAKALDAMIGHGEKGLYFMLPELAKDVVTSPIVSKMLQLGSLGRLASPVGAALTAAGLGKNVYDQYQEFKSLPPEQQEMFKQQFIYDGMTDELGNRIGASTGGRIKYAEGSDDETDIPTLKNEEEFFGKTIKHLPKEGIRGLYFGVKENQREVPIDPETGEPTPVSGKSIKEFKDYLALKIPERRPEIGYKDEKFDLSVSRGVNPFIGDLKNRYEASYTPNQDAGTFSVSKGPGYIGAGYGKEDIGNFYINKTPSDIGAGYTYDKDNLSYGIQGLLDKMGNKDIQARIKYKF
jgi:hypothetical protein